MKATMLLCDYAEELGGKLYIMGGGWSKMFMPNQPSNMSLAVKLTIPSDEADQPHDIDVRLVDEDHESVFNDEGQEIELKGKLELRQPRGVRPETSLDSVLAFTFNGLILAPGTYIWELGVDQEVLESVPFDVIAPYS